MYSRTLYLIKLVPGMTAEREHQQFTPYFRNMCFEILGDNTYAVSGSGRILRDVEEACSTHVKIAGVLGSRSEAERSYSNWLEYRNGEFK